MNEFPDVICHLTLLDETHFERSGCANKQNMRYWSEPTVNELHVKPLHTHRVRLRCGISTFDITDYSSRLKLAVLLL